MNRRQLLHPAVLAQEAGLLRFAGAAPPESPEPFTLLRFSRRAMGTVFEIGLRWGTPTAQAAAEAALNHIDELDAQLSIYRDDSEVSQINRRAFQEPVVIESRLFELLRSAQKLWELSRGAFDPACGALVEAWGFFRGSPRVPTEEERQTALRQCGMRFVELEPTRRTIRFRREGLKLNLGAIGKGYALDCAAALLRAEFGITAAVLTGGRSSILAIGAPPASPTGWPIGLTDPHQPECRLATVWLRDQALGTSAGTYKNFEHQGRKLHHLLDPRTGWPGNLWSSATCVARQAAAADALATACFLTAEDALPRLVAAAEVSAFLTQSDGKRTLQLGASVPCQWEEKTATGLSPWDEQLKRRHGLTAHHP